MRMVHRNYCRYVFILLVLLTCTFTVVQVMADESDQGVSSLPIPEHPDDGFDPDQGSIGGRHCDTPIDPNMLDDDGDNDFVTLHAPQLRAGSGTRVVLPFGLELASEQQRITSWEFRLEFDQQVLRPVEVVQENTLSNAWEIEVARSEEGHIDVSGTSLTPIVESGVLLSMSFDVIGRTGDGTDLLLHDVLFNAGDDPATSCDACFIVGSIYLPLVTK